MGKNTFFGILGIGLIALMAAVTLMAAGGDIQRGGVAADLTMLAGILAFLPPTLRILIQWIKPESNLLVDYGWSAQSDAIAATFTTGCRLVRRAHRQTFAGLHQRGAVARDLSAGRQTPANPSARRAGRQTGGSGTATRQAAGGKSADDDGGGDGEPPRPLLSQAALAELLGVTKKTLQNQYSATPWLLPPAIQIPGARGPRWTPQSVQQWLDDRPQHTAKTAPHNKTRKVGRPRIAYAGGGAA